MHTVENIAHLLKTVVKIYNNCTYKRIIQLTIPIYYRLRKEKNDKREVKVHDNKKIFNFLNRIKSGILKNYLEVTIYLKDSRLFLKNY